jgi:plasmid stability protein
MSHVPTLNIRNVPERVVATLRRRAKENGRSLNAEVVEALKDYDERHTRADDLLRQLEEFRREWLAPPDAPTPEEMIRAGREERDRRIAGDL